MSGDAEMKSRRRLTFLFDERRDQWRSWAIRFLRSIRIHDKISTDYRDDDKRFLDYVIRRFNLSSARLNKPQGLDLR